MDVLIVDWLPRGGIAQDTEACRRVGVAAGHTVVVAGRTGGELRPDVAAAPARGGKFGAVVRHRELARIAARAIEERRPDVVQVQNYWLPTLERPVLDAARRVGARTVLTLHNHRPHSLASGTRIGLQRLVDRADTVLVHSTRVAEGIAELGHTDIRVAPLLLMVDVIEHPPVRPPELSAPTMRRALSFGVLRRGYKGVDMAPALAANLPPRWDLVLAGAGAPAVTGAASVDRFLDAAELRWTVESATAVFLPYRDATQSGAVVLAQALGVPPVTTPVGGVPEQVIDGVTGVLLDLAPVEAWSEVLWEIDRRPDWWAAMGERCREVSAAREQEAMDGWLSALGLVEGDVRERGNGR